MEWARGSLSVKAEVGVQHGAWWSIRCSCSITRGFTLLPQPVISLSPPAGWQISRTHRQECYKGWNVKQSSRRELLTFGSWPSSEPAGLTSSARVCSQLSSRVRRRKLSPSKQSSARGSSFLLANGSGWQHQSSTRAFQLPLGRGRTRLNSLRGAKAITGDLVITVQGRWGFVAAEQFFLLRLEKLRKLKSEFIMRFFSLKMTSMRNVLFRHPQTVL